MKKWWTTLSPFASKTSLPSLWSRLAFWNVLMLTLTLLILGSIVYSVVSINLQASLDKRLTTQGEKLQAITRVWLINRHPINGELFEQLAQSMQQNEFTADNLYIKLFDVKTGQPLQHSPNLQQSRIHYTQSDFRAAISGASVFTTYHDKTGNAVRVLTMPLLDTARHTIAVAQIGRSLDNVHQVETLLILVLCAGGVGAVILAYGLSLALTSRETQPLSQLSEEMRNFSVGELGACLEPKQRIREVVLLTEAFNQMSQRLEASFTLQRNFVADVSHELRTPLTSLRGQTDILLLNPDLQKDVRQDVQQIRGELVRLSHLVSNLLVMARVEVGVLPEPSAQSIQRVELDLLLVEITRQATFLRRDVSVELGSLQQVLVTGERDALKQMLLNIIDNALTYTPTRGKVEVEMRETTVLPAELAEKQGDAQARWAVISIRDTGPGIAPADVPHIFERHYRAERTRARGTLGAGIGLSLARLIARAHHGDITVESELMKGSCFHIWLPLSPAWEEQPAQAN